MKNKLIINTLLLYGAVCLPGCDEESRTQDITIINDQTEIYFNGVSFDDYKRVSILSSNLNNGEHLHLGNFTETGFNKFYDFQIEVIENPLNGNDYLRKQEIDSFYANVLEAFLALDSTGKEQKGSVIYKVIAEELNRLSESKANEKILIINSDLYEKSSLADFYLTDTLASIVKHPETMMRVFQDKYPLKNLQGIKVYIIYEPLNQEDSNKFELVSGFYKNLLTSRGAVVSIQGSL
jgi:hypothetical protein